MQGIIRSKLLIKGLLLFVIAGLWSCETSDKIGLEITPPGERFKYYIDTTSTIRVSTLRQDSLTTEKRERSLLGSMKDPVFGHSSAGILTQLRLSSNEVDFGEEAVLDSVVLLLKYQGGYGDTTVLQNIKVYELEESLYFDSTYYSNIDATKYYSESGIVADMEFLPNPSGDSLAIRLDESLGEKILFAEDAELKDNTSFLEYFKGLYLRSMPVDQEGSVMYFNLAGGKSRMTVYYQNSEEDSLQYEVVINSNCTYLNTFEHDYTGSESEASINDSAAGSGNFYIQSMAGLRAHVRIEFSDTLMQLSYDGIAINKAELIMPVSREYIVDNKPVPGSLQVFNAKEDGTNEFIGDLFLGEEYYGGFYDKANSTYSFNIARYIQDLLDPQVVSRLANTGLFIVVKDARIAANQVVLKNDPQGEKIRLEITYTVFD